MFAPYHERMNFRVSLAGALLALCLGVAPGCTSTAPSARADAPAATNGADARSVLLVSIDGFRPDYLDLGLSPTLSRLAREGVRADWMNPSYPSLTFPNHYTLVTGLRPDHQGIVHNTMHDEELGRFTLSNRDAVGDARWWGGEPVWVTAEKAGLPTATLYWPGSEAEIGGVRPTRWYGYVDGQTLAPEVRVDTVLGWLSEPPATRPRIATLYFEQVDKAAHFHGPFSTEAKAALAMVDAAMARLLQGLEASGARERVDLIVVSDHGMAEVTRERVLAVEDLVTREEAVVMTVGQVINIAPNPGFEDAVAQRLAGSHAQYDCWRKEDLPARWHYGTHPRIAPIVCQMHEGWDMIPRAAVAQRPVHARGSHGYDPALPSMRALFLASGPSFRTATRIPAFDNVHVYPLLARLVGIAPAPNDGELAPLLPALRETPAR